MPEMNKDLVTSVLELARFYPSGDNSQPFRFRLSSKNNTLWIDYKAKEAKHTLAYDEFTLLITLGCLLEYIRNSFANFNSPVTIDINLDGLDVTRDYKGVCSISCVNSISKVTPIIPQNILLQRVTDRRPFKSADTIDIDIKTFDNLLSYSKCQLFTDAESEFLDFFAYCDSLVWQSKKLGIDIMSAVSFSTPPCNTGLPWRNLGLKKAETIPIRLLQNNQWLFNVFKNIGAGKTMEKSQRELWGSSSSFLIFSYDIGINDKEKILANMELMNVLLQLSEQGYSFQPSTMSTEVLNLPVKPNLNLQDAANLNLDSISSKIKLIRKKLQINDRQVNWVLRCGKQVEPFPINARTLRHPVEELLTIED